MLLFLAFIFLWCTGEAVIINGRCNESIEVEQNFNSVLYSGRWYEMLRYETPNEFDIQCVSVNYTLLGTGNLNAQNKGVFQNAEVQSNALLFRSNPSSTDGKWSVTYSANPLPYWILGTDYDTFSIVYSCTNLPPALNSSSVTSWILTRIPALSGAVIAEVDAILERSNLLWNLYKPTFHTAAACAT